MYSEITLKNNLSTSIKKIRKNILKSINDAFIQGEYDHDKWDEDSEGADWIYNEMTFYFEYTYDTSEYSKMDMSEIKKLNNINEWKGYLTLNFDINSLEKIHVFMCNGGSDNNEYWNTVNEKRAYKFVSETKKSMDDVIFKIIKESKEHYGK